MIKSLSPITSGALSNARNSYVSNARNSEDVCIDNRELRKSARVRSNGVESDDRTISGESAKKLANNGPHVYSYSFRYVLLDRHSLGISM
jgi:hypothetical protein